MLNPRMIPGAVLIAAHDHPFHPVREYLNRCADQWDHRPRADTWLTAYLGAADNFYTRAIGRKWLLSAVARIFRPGIKADYVLVTEGAQGKKKSTAFEKLSEPWFTSGIPDFGSKDSQMSMAGVWLIEMDELERYTKKESIGVKAFISRAKDRFRPPYGRYLIDCPRQSILCGTTNDRTSMQDWTGNRRYWFIRPGKVRLEEIMKDRDQIWGEMLSILRAVRNPAEAVRQNAHHWIDEESEPELAARAAHEQQARLESDTWADTVIPWLNRKLSEFDPADDRSQFSVSIGEIFEGALQIPVRDHRQADQNRVSHILQSQGWYRKRPQTDGVRQWRYFPPGELEEGFQDSDVSL